MTPPGGGLVGPAAEAALADYRPLSELLRDAAARAPAPLVVALAGSVAVGKSTAAAVLAELAAQWPARPRVRVVSADGFLLPNRLLAELGLAHRKGFPETYDLEALGAFLAAVKAGRDAVVPVYSHVAYDVVDGETHDVGDADVVIVEGLHVLAPLPWGPTASPVDVGVYLDAHEALLEEWYVARFRQLRDQARHDPGAFFHQFVALDDGALDALARQVWTGVNLPNLRHHIAPTRRRADVVVEKGPGHRVVAQHVRRR